MFKVTWIEKNEECSLVVDAVSYGSNGNVLTMQYGKSEIMVYPQAAYDGIKIREIFSPKKEIGKSQRDNYVEGSFDAE